MAGLLDGFLSLAKGTNTTKDRKDETLEGTAGPLQEEAVLSLDNEELIRLKNGWEQKWAQYEPQVRKKQEECLNYWLGKHFSQVQMQADNRPMTDNAIFESVETFLPVATKRNPEPQVSTDDTPEGQKLAQNVQKMLVFQADRLRLKLKLKRMTRNWALYFLGAVKMGFSEAENDIAIAVVRPTRLILDPDATIEDSEYNGEYLGEIKREKASTLAVRFSDKKSDIEKFVNGKMGTMINYTEWWTKEMVFWTLGSEVLGKAENPHWNKAEERSFIDELGNVQEETIPGNNHFTQPKIPYVFLSVFNVGLHPHDDTSLIHQNLANQDLVNKRIRQIDKNADNTNSGLVVSGDHFTEDAAQRAAESLRKGGVVYVPSGDVNTAVKRDVAPALPAFMYQSLVDYRQRLMDIFGTRGTAPSGLLDENSVRGKIMTRGADQSRIGGGVSEFLEQAADQIFNWMVQIMYVYYDERHYGAVLGSVEGKIAVALSNQNFNRKLTVSVKEGSLIPKDDVSKANLASDLAGGGKMALVDLYEQLDYGNPQEMATRAWLEINAPHLLYGNDPRVLQAIQEQQAQEQAIQQEKQGGGQQKQEQPQQSQSLLSEVPIQQ